MRTAGGIGRVERHPRRRTMDHFDAGDVLAGGGEMGALMRSLDWSKTPLGPVSGWSHALRTTVGLLLRNRFPLLLWWGPKFVQFYNDAYRPILGEKHPRSLAQSASECWSEIWHIIGPMIEAPYSGQAATWSDDLSLLIDRKGFLEETHFKVAYSPVPDDTVPDTGVGGVLATVAETTEQVYGERQLKTLRELGARAAEAKTPRRACEMAAATFKENPSDVPFALFYLIEPGKNRAWLSASMGFDATNLHAAPPVIELRLSAPGDLWPVARIVESRAAEIITGLAASFPNLPRGRWSQSPHTAICLPLSSPNQAPYGVLIAGCNPHRALDDGYRTFFELAAAQVITAIRNANAYEEQRQRAERLAEIDRAKTAFFSNISHEFRTPLSLMLGPTEDLLVGAQGELSGPQRAQLELLRRNELRLHRLVNALLDFSRIEAGRAQASYEPVDLAQLTQDIASAFRSAVERAGLNFTIACPPLNEPSFVDKDMWEQIVLNLLSNAFKFTFEGGIVVSQTLDETHVELVVTDTGVGVRPEDLSRLFERFHRVEGTRARTHEGSGIGLALVQELVRLHGGTIQATSRYGAGTSFKVRIPRGSGHLPADRIAAAGVPAISSGRPTLFVEEALRWLPLEFSADEPGTDALMPHASPCDKKRRVLVADDNADMREYLRRILSEHWTVETVNDGAEALKVALLRRPDLILADVMMPVMDGFRLLRELKVQVSTSRIPFIMLSARTGEESCVEGLQAGADDYLVKPFSARELVARINTQLELAKLQDELRAQQRQLFALFMQAPVPICVIRGEELVYEMANEPYFKLMGRSDLVGKTLFDVFPELRDQVAEGRNIADIFRGIMATGERFDVLEAPLTFMHNGKMVVRYFNGACERVHSPDGSADRVMVVTTDVTDQVLARRHAEEAERQLKDTITLRDEFLTGAAHELRTPLTTLGFHTDGLIHLLRQAPPRDPTAERCLPRAEKLRHQANRLEHLIEDMIDVFSLRREKLQLINAEMDLAEVTQAVVDRVRKESKQAEAALVFSAEPSRGLWDRQRVEQILTHLISNAVKFGGGQTVEVIIGGTAEKARIVVKDHGIGVASEDQERIFHRFVRLAPTTQFGGFGLGLWVVRELALAMGGGVSVESQPGRGATFTVELPRQT